RIHLPARKLGGSHHRVETPPGLPLPRVDGVAEAPAHVALGPAGDPDRAPARGLAAPHVPAHLPPEPRPGHPAVEISGGRGRMEREDGELPVEPSELSRA